VEERIGKSEGRNRKSQIQRGESQSVVGVWNRMKIILDDRNFFNERKHHTIKREKAQMVLEWRSH